MKKAQERRTGAHTHIHTYIKAYVHTCMHIHAHMHTHMNPSTHTIGHIVVLIRRALSHDHLEGERKQNGGQRQSQDVCEGGSDISLKPSKDNLKKTNCFFWACEMAQWVKACVANLMT